MQLNLKPRWKPLPFLLLCVLVHVTSGCGSERAPSDPFSDDRTTGTSTDAIGEDGVSSTDRGVRPASDERVGPGDALQQRDSGEAAGTISNPLIEALPGFWNQLEPSEILERRKVEVFPNRPSCDWGGGGRGEPGDACVKSFSPIGNMILDGTILRAHLSSGTRAEGRVLVDEDPLKVEFDYEDAQDKLHFVYVKVE